MSSSVYVSNLAATTTEETLATKFSQFGTVLSVKKGRDPESGQPGRYGFVEMKTSDQAGLAAQSLKATGLDGRVLSVDRAARSWYLCLSVSQPYASARRPGYRPMTHRLSPE